MINTNRLCRYCLRETDLSSGTCIHCGRNPVKEPKRSPRCLPMFTILAGRYLIGRVLGEGGFGITYLSIDLTAETRVAIKEYFPVDLASRDHLSEEGNALAVRTGDAEKHFQNGLKRFEKEARTLAKLNELPGIVTVHDFFQENNTAYFVMDYVEGETLRDYLRGSMQKTGHALPYDRAFELMKPVLNSLQKIHEAGIIHRDISPENILVGRDGAMTLIDFGASKEEDAARENRSMTVMVKHGYAPEEQYRTHGMQGAWTDVYAACATLYHMISGILPKDAIERLISDTVAPLKTQDLTPPVPPAYSDVIEKGMQVLAKHRYQSMADLLKDLDAAENAIAAQKAAEEKRRAEEAKRKAAEERAAKAAAEKAEREAEKAAEAARQAESEGNSQETNKSKKRGFLIAGIAACILLAIFAVIRFGGFGGGSAAGSSYAEKKLSEFAKKEYYKEAETLKQQGDMLGAAISYGKAQDYEDAQERSLELWEEYGNLKHVSSGSDKLAALREDGTVLWTSSFNSDVESYKNVAEWKNIVSVCCMFSTGNLFAIRSDGRVLNAFYNYPDLAIWNDAVEVVTFHNTSCCAVLHRDGTVSMVDTQVWYKDAAAPALLTEDLGGDWRNITHIAACYSTYGGDYEICLAGVREGEDLVISGFGDDLDLSSVRMNGNKSEPFEANWTLNAYNYEGTEFRKIEGCEDHIILLSEDGKPYIYTIDGPSVSSMDYDPKTIAYFESMDDVVDIAAEDWRVLAVREDGSVASAELYSETIHGLSENANEDLYDEYAVEIAEVDSEAGAWAAVTKDGTLLYEREFGLGLECSGWTDVKQIRGNVDAMVGLRTDGTILTNIPKGYLNTLPEWRDVIALHISQSVGGYTYGLRSDGTILQNHFESEPETIPEEWMPDHGTVTDVTESGLLVMLLDDGTVWITKEYLAEMFDEDAEKAWDAFEPCLAWADIIDVAAFDDRIIGLRADGTIVCSASVDGEETWPEEILPEWENVVKIAIQDSGFDQIAALREDGSVYYVKGDHETGTASFGTAAEEIFFTDDLLVCMLEDGTAEFVDPNYGNPAMIEKIEALIDYFAIDLSQAKQFIASRSYLILLNEDGTVETYSLGISSREAQETWTGLRTSW